MSAVKAKKLEQAQIAEERAKIVYVQRGREKLTVEDPMLYDGIMQAFSLNAQAQGIKVDLDAFKIKLADIAKSYLDDDGTLHFLIPQEGATLDVKVSFGYDVKIIDDKMTELRKHLGDRFDLLVDKKETFKPTSKLVEMASAAESPLKNMLMIVPKSPSFAFVVK